MSVEQGRFSIVAPDTATPLNSVTEMQAVEGNTVAFPSSTGQLFGEYFSPTRSWKFSKNDLIDARGRRLFETTAMACHADAYPFQIPLEAKTGPEVRADGHAMLMLSSYDYLGLIGDPRIDAAAIAAVKKYGTGTGGARLLTGTTDQHQRMERDLAAFRGTEAAVTFSSGYAANLAVIGALFGPADRVIMDMLCHRSLTDACRFAGVQLQRFQHNDMGSLRHEIQNGTFANRTLIITEGVFSMDGDICLLPEIIEIKKELGCFLLVDESHATGVLGATGRGVDEHFGIAANEVDIWTGSLAKAIPSTGGFVAGSRELAIFLQHAASPYIFSAALSPASVGAIREALVILAREPERVAAVGQNAHFLRGGLQKLGYDTGLSETAVIPVILKDEVTTALFARRLRDYGILAAPVLFPAVPQGSARLRLCVTAAHTRAHLEFALEVFSQMAKGHA
jgi:glycine C-acetyltransferase